MKITYTETAKSELERLTNEIKEDLEKKIINDKFVFGDDMIEVTAYDIRIARSKLSREWTKNSRGELTKLFSKIYLLLGASIMLLGIFYNDITIIITSKIQLFMVISGMMIIFMSYMLNYMYKVRFSQKAKYYSRILDESQYLTDAINEFSKKQCGHLTVEAEDNESFLKKS